MKLNGFLMKIFLIIVSLYSVSCATGGIPPLEKKTDTLVVLPMLFIDGGLSLSSNGLNLSLILPVENISTGKEEKIEFWSMTGEYLFFQKLNPGKYATKEKALVTGKEFPLRLTMQNIKVSEGRLTILPFKFIVYTRDKSEYYYYNYNEFKKEDYSKVIAVLKNDPNFKSWKIIE
jgi:hypothetical protein